MLGDMWTFVLLLTAALSLTLVGSAQAAQPHRVNAKKYSRRMLDSIIARRDGIGSSGAATSQIELVCIAPGCLEALRTHNDTAG